MENNRSMRSERTRGQVSTMLTREVIDRATQARRGCFRCGKPCSRKLRSSERAAYEAAKGNHYIVTRSQEAWPPTIGWCEQTVRAAIRVLPRRRFAEVVMDLITVPDAQLHREAAHEALALLKYAAAPPCWISVGEITRCDRIPIDPGRDGCGSPVGHRNGTRLMSDEG